MLVQVSSRLPLGRIEDADCIVAATAFVYDAEVLTTNVKHFPMFPDLVAAY